MSRQNNKAFTLIELLVVISVIVLLIAILLPVLSEARRAAELVRCKVNIRQNAQVVIAASTDFDGDWGAVRRAGGVAGSTTEAVVRQRLGNSIRDSFNFWAGYSPDIRFFKCPLSPHHPIDINDIDTIEAEGLLVIYSNYSQYWGLTNAVGNPLHTNANGDVFGFKRAEQSGWKWTDYNSGETIETRVLLSDLDFLNGANVESSHRDAKSSEAYEVVVPGPVRSDRFWAAVYYDPITSAATRQYDVNYAFIDGSVQTIGDLRFELGSPESTVRQLTRLGGRVYQLPTE